MLGMAGVSRVSFILSWQFLDVEQHRKPGCSLLVVGTGQFFLMLITMAFKINIFSLALMTFCFQGELSKLQFPREGSLTTSR